MDFSSNQKTKINNQLIKLRNQLFKKHLALSIPVVVCIALGLIVINLVNNTYNANLGRQLKLKQFPPQHILPDIIKLSFNNTVKHLHFLSEMILTLTEQNSNIYNGSMNLRYYKMFTAGGVCLLDQGSCQYRFAKLTNLIWYYQQSQQLNLMIDRVILCTKNGNTCAGTSPPNSDAITSQQLQFISDLSVNVSKPGQTSQLSIYNRLTDRIYMAVQISRSEMGHSDIDTVIIVKLENIKNIISSLDKKIQKSNIKQLQIVMGYPQAYQHRQTNQPSCLMCIYEKTSQSIEIFYDPQLPNKKTLFMLIEVKYSRYQDNMSYATGVSFFVCFLFVVFILRNQKQSISHWVRDNFYSKHLINQLYKYTIRDIFIGVKPNISNILQRGPSSELFRCLSELVDKSITPIYPEPEPNHYKQPFKFTSKITEIIENYKKSVEPLMQAKNRNILANRFNIQTFINDLCQSQARMIKQYYLRAQELRILKQFFNFAYMAVLRPVEEFLTFISQNQSPLPKKLLDFFIKMNENIHQVQKVRQKIESLQNDTKEQKQKEKKLSQSQRMHTTLSNFERVNTFQPQRVGSEHQGREQQSYLQQNKQQLQIRIRVHMIPKYLTILRDLDSRNNSLSIEDRRDSQKQESGCTYAQILHLDRELRSLGEIIENTRYLLTKHNKTIRMFNK